VQIQELVNTFQALSPTEQQSLLNTLQRAYLANTQPERLEDLHLRYPDEWIAVMIPKGEDRYAPQRGYLLAHHQQRSAVWQAVEARGAAQDIFFLPGRSRRKALP
jgi:hypothetical protein